MIPRISPFPKQRVSPSQTSVFNNLHHLTSSLLLPFIMSSFSTEAARWRALTIRDAAANGQFVYTVKSTKIYCRPTCPARLARRANVGFHKTSAQAQAAGFRACKRCKPEIELEEDPQERKVAMAVGVIHEMVWDTCERQSAGERDGERGGEGIKGLRLKDLADKVGLTPRYFHKIFKDKMGVTPNEYAKRKMQEQLEANKVPVLSGEQDQTTPDSLDINTFNFHEFLDLEMDPNLAMDNTLIMGDANQTLPVPFDQTIDANIQNLPSAFSNGEKLGDLSLLGFDEINEWNWDSPISNSGTFELDAALLLNANTCFISDCRAESAGS
jgi:methylphosphotriester-DNA--protein-cysteine methyltransferase